MAGARPDDSPRRARQQRGAAQAARTDDDAFRRLRAFRLKLVIIFQHCTPPRQARSKDAHVEAIIH